LYNATEPDQLRGPQHDGAWVDELAKFKYVQETWDQLQFGLRLGVHPRQIVTTTPRPIPIVKKLLADRDTLLLEDELMTTLITSLHRFYDRLKTGTAGLVSDVRNLKEKSLKTFRALSSRGRALILDNRRPEAPKDS
jgi:hypothetical protein